MRLYQLSIYACVQIGHNSSNKRCPSNVDLSDMFEDDEVEDDGATGEEDDLIESDLADEENNSNIDELLYSDEELFYKWKYILI